MYNAATASPNLNSAKPWYKHRWPWLLMIGPVVVILAGIHTTWIAFTQQDALVVGDYYKQGKAINQDLRRDRVAASLGLSLDLRYDPAAGKLNGRVLGNGRPVPDAIRVRLIHPTRPEKDIGIAAQPDQNGMFSVALPMLERARWQVQIENEHRDWRLGGTWKWPQEQAISIKADLAH